MALGLLVLLQPLMLKAGAGDVQTVHLTTRPVVTPWSGAPRVALPVAFEAERGTGDRVPPAGSGWLARTRTYAVRLEADAVLLAPAGGSAPPIRLTLVDARRDAASFSSPSTGVVQYLETASSTRRSLHAEVGYRAVWPGVDVRYRGTDGRVEQDFLVASGSDPSVIALRADAVASTIGQDGALTLTHADGDLVRLEAPRAWEVLADGGERPVAVRYAPRADGAVGFALGPRDTQRPLVIDPVLTYSRAIGGNGADEATAVALDAQGRIHVAGYSASTDLAGTRIGGTGGGGDVFVARLDPTGQVIEYMSYFGGSQGDSVRGLAVDAAGRVHVAGTTHSTDFPVAQPLPGQGSAAAGSNGFVASLDAGGASLTFSSYLGGSDADEAHAIAVAPDGRLVIVGETRSANFPVRNAHESELEGLDGFVTVLSNAGALQWSTFLGGQVSDSLVAVAVDAAGQVVVAGTSNSPDHPTLQSAQAFGGGFDATVARFSSSGALQVATYLGGSGNDAAQAITVDLTGAIHVGGTTSSPNFPASLAVGPVGTSMDAFHAVYAPTGARGQVRRLGGSGMDRARAIAVDATGVYLAGQTASIDFPVVRPAQVSSAGNRDAFVAMIDASGIAYATYVGTSGNDDASGIAVDGVGRVVLTGSLQVTGTPNRGSTDAFLFRLSSGSEGSDTDNDQLPDAWETQFNLDPRLSDANADPDGDGLSNLQEYQQGTHPLGRHARYLAEGATIPPFETRLALFNPTPQPTAVLVRFLCQRACGVPDIPGQDTVVRRLVTLAPFARGTLEVSGVPGLADEEFATIIEADQPVVVDRTMTWDGTAYGSHTETAMLAPAAVWHLAEGATTNGFKLYYLLQNPNAAEAVVTVEYLLGNGAPPVTSTYRLPPRSRTTLDVSTQHPSLRAAEISARLATDPETPILVERAMYLNAGGRLFGAGHASAGITTPAPNWSFAEGATGPYFDTFLLIANASTDVLPVRATFLLPSGQAVTRTYEVAPKSRFNIWVDQAAPELADTAVSAQLESLDERPFVAERAMWWPGPAPSNWREAHNSPGSLTTSAVWGLADGLQGGPLATDTYLLIANTSPLDGVARVTLSFEDDGSRRSRDYAVAARSRTNVPIRDEFPEATGRRFASLVESQGSLPAQLVVERAMYADSGRERWASGTNALGTPLANERVISITPQGVTPRILVVAPGEAITIRNLDTVPHQMFSGPYLERSACPALNQIGYLAPGQSRTSGNFTTAGTCPFLDDVRPGQQLNREFQGYVIVR